LLRYRTLNYWCSQHQQMHWSAYYVFLICSYTFRRIRHLQVAYTNIAKIYSYKTVL
jgi:hypothetical protein